MATMTALGSVASARALPSGHAADGRRPLLRLPRIAAAATSVTVPVVAAMTILLHLRDGGTQLTGWWYGNLALMATLAVPAVLLVMRRPANRIGWLMCVGCLTEGLCGAGREYLVHGLLGGWAPGWLWLGWFTDSLYIPSVATLPMILLLFPDGVAVSRWTRAALMLPVGGVALAWPSYLFAGDIADIRGRVLANPAGSVLPDSLAHSGLSAGMALLVASLLVSVLSLAIRYSRSRGERRVQMKWVVWAGSLLAVELGTEFIPGNSVATYTSTVAVALFAAALAIAILRHRLFDVDVVINRTLVFGVLTASLIGGYVGIVALFGLVFGGVFHPATGLLPTALVAVGFAPARQRVQAGVDRMMYGERKNPYGVMSRLGRRLQGVDRRGELGVVVDTVAQALRAPYAAIVDPAGAVLAAAGEPGREPQQHPLTYQGESVGALLVQPRQGASQFGRDEQRLLADLAPQVGAAVHAVRLSADLQASRRRLVTAKEEERRRLRRDLHDGLGPQLAALGLKLDAARDLVERDPERSRAVLSSVKADIRGAIDDIRRLVYDLRPPALDELGLVAAIRDYASRIDTAAHGGLAVRVDAPAVLASLPAAVEVAAYRIVTEALTNVVRHAAAEHCRVHVAITDELELEVADDGAGIASDWRPGVGTQSMVERAAELGGELVVEPLPGALGTRVRARLPLDAVTP